MENKEFKTYTFGKLFNNEKVTPRIDHQGVTDEAMVMRPWSYYGDSCFFLSAAFNYHTENFDVVVDNIVVRNYSDAPDIVEGYCYYMMNLLDNCLKDDDPIQAFRDRMKASEEALGQHIPVIFEKKEDHDKWLSDIEECLNTEMKAHPPKRRD